MEKRRYQRLPREIAINISFQDPATKERKEVERSCSRNLSALGLLVTTDKKLEIGSSVHVEFYLPDSPEYMTLNAHVVRVEEVVEDQIYEIGLEFREIDDLALAKINAIVIHDSGE